MPRIMLTNNQRKKVVLREFFKNLQKKNFQKNNHKIL